MTGPGPDEPRGAATAGAVLALVVDDEPAIRRVVAAYLTQEGFAVLEAADGTGALDLARTRRPDVVVLDLMLPDLDGIEVCRRLRTFTDAYVVMLTARAEEVDTLIGLSVGADDYLTKPFSPRVLVARIRTLLRRPRVAGDPADAPVRVFGDLRIDVEGREVTLGGERVDLTRTEFDILDTLSARPRHVHTRRQLVESVWGPGYVGDERLADVHVSHLRAKLAEDARSPRYVVTVRGVGFKMGEG
ncbi:response regulator [Nocardioides sp.]|uniref:response regulator n=1 Tax=Nocardioides sp. TaxID=35761 RepID=UPI00378404E1